MSKKNSSSKTVGIAVTPILQDTGANTTACEIDAMSGSSSHVKGGIVKLKSNNSYELNFEIQQSSDPGAPDVLFATPGTEAFWCDADSCSLASGPPPNGCFLSNPTVSADQKTLTVEANPGGGDGLMFYRLNFDDGTSYDPIIIHN